MAERAGLLKWNLKDIAESLFLDPDEAREYFTDGRRVSFIFERRIRREILKGTLASTARGESRASGHFGIDMTAHVFYTGGHGDGYDT